MVVAYLSDPQEDKQSSPTGVQVMRLPVQPTVQQSRWRSTDSLHIASLAFPASVRSILPP